MAETPVPISDLRDWANRIFDAVERRGVTSIDLSGRYYWMLVSDEIWGGEPPKAVVGDLADDLGDLRSDLGPDFDDADRSVFALHTLDHFIGVLGKLSADLKGHEFVDGDAA